MYTIYIIDRANQISQQTFATQEQADDASDRLGRGWWLRGVHRSHTCH